MTESVGDVSGIDSIFQWRIPQWKSWMNENMVVDNIISPSFSFWNAVWHLEIYYSRETRDLSLHLMRDTSEQDTQVVTFKQSVRKSDGTEYIISEGDFKFNENDDELESFLSEENFLNDQLAPEGNLTISCAFYKKCSVETAEAQNTSKDGQTCTEEENDLMKDSRIGDVAEKCSNAKDEQKNIEEKENFMKNNTTSDVTEESQKLTGVHKLAEDLKNLLIAEEDCDVSIKVKDREFKAHRIILQSRSPVFYSMFKHDMVETSTGTVEVTDCDPEEFQNFLGYLYTGSVEHLSNDTVVNLYCIADKYDAEEVKKKCVEFMKNKLSVETFCDVVALALKHEESALLETATEFFCDNIKEIIVTVQWQSFLKENTVAANELHIKALVNYDIRK